MSLHVVHLTRPDDMDGWRAQARRLMRQGVDPRHIIWTDRAEMLPAAPEHEDIAPVAGGLRMPHAFLDLARQVICHRDAERFALLYRLLWRLRDERGLMSMAIDADVARAQAMAKAVRRDIHKMRAFVRFRRHVQVGGEERFIAWFEPDHHIVEVNAPFFVRRFANMRWSILTPERSVHWDGAELSVGPGAARTDAPPDDSMEDIWRAYYASIFNPARLKPAMMRSEMPMKYWRNLPEASLVRSLTANAQERVQTMIREGATPANARPQRTAPSVRGGVTSASVYDRLKEDAEGCRACPLWKPATQTVFGEGPIDAAVMFVGEQPGDAEDLEGRPFVGPAGRLFDRAMADAGLDRGRVYVTNAVKHFKFEARGRRRIHQKPTIAEMRACRPWLEREMDLVQPGLIVALGATAAHSLMGAATPIGKNRGAVKDLAASVKVLITVHPSFLLRLPDEEAKRTEYGRFVEDLRLARPFMARRAA